MIHEYDQKDKVTSTRLRAQHLGPLLEFDLHAFIDDYWGDTWGFSRFLVSSVIFSGLLGILSIQIPNLPLFATEWLIGLAPIWVPVTLIILSARVWVWYVRALYISKQQPLLLEVKFSRDIVRSPRAMEDALTELWYDSGETTFYNTFWGGQVRPYMAFEIASFGGDVHFYVWCWKNWRAPIEAALYAHYPEIELIEVEDYATKFNYDPDKYDAFPTDWRYEPRNDAYPIRTYVEFELDKDPKEEYKIDPLAQVLERMSNLRPDEQMWLSIIITMSKDKRRKPGGAFWEVQDRFTGTLTEEINKLRKEATGDVNDPAERWKQYARVQLYRYTEVIRAIDRNMGKLPFNVGIHGVYISSEGMSAPGYTPLRWIWRPFANPQYMNQLRPRRWGNPFDYPWQDVNDFRWTLMCRRFFDAYRRRSYFYSPWIFPHNMMSTEVIATIWHPPSRSITAPGLQRISAKKSEPPPDLPM